MSRFRDVRVLVLLCLIFTSLHAQPERVLGRYLARRWSDAQGLFSGRIASVAQTHDGYLWIGTERGLIRFDGLRFQSIPVPGPDPIPDIMDLTVDRDGMLWIRTENARLLRYDGHTFTAVLSREQGESAVVAVSPAAQHGLILAGLNHGVALAEGSHLTKLYAPDAHAILSLAQTQDGDLWIGTREDGLYRVRGGSVRVLHDGLPDSKVNCVLPAADGRLWIGTDTGLAVWDGHSVQTLKLFDKPISAQLLTMTQDRSGDLWIGTSEGLLRYTNAGAQWVRHNGLAVTALLRDREGDLWFGDGPVLERLRDTTFIPLGALSNSEGAKSGAVYVDARDRIWSALPQGGLRWVRDGTVHEVKAYGLNHDVVYSIDGRGDEVWLGRQNGGLTRLRMDGDKAVATTWTEKDGLVQNSIYSIRVLDDGTIWACSLSRGVSEWSHGTFRNFDQSALGSQTVQAVEQTTDGRVWFATTKGLAAKQGDVWQRVGTAQEVTALLADKQNGLWLGSAAGLQYLNSKGQLLPVLNTAVDHPILGLAMDSSGLLWLGTSQGVFSANVEPLPGTATSLSRLRSYGPSDGLSVPSVVNRSRSMVSDNQGRVWLSTGAGLAFTANHNAGPSVPALTHIEAIWADGVPLQTGEHSLEVPPGTRRLTFGFTGLDLRAPEQVRLRYRLDGFDHKWSAASNEREATYTNLPPKRYRFHAMAQNSDGQWNETGDTLEFRVLPTLLDRWDLRLGIIAILLGLIAWTYRARVQFVVAQAEIRAEERLSERTRIARELHDTLLQGFISVVMHLHVTADGVPKDSPLRKGLDHLLQMMESVIEEARLAVQGLRQPDQEAGPISESLRNVVQRLQPEDGPAISIEFSGRERAVRAAVEEEFCRVAGEAVANAVRHADATAVQVGLTFGKTDLLLTVADDGIGMDAPLLSSGRAGHFGLAGMRERARNVGGRLFIESSRGQGTRVLMSVPARYAYESGHADPLSRLKEGDGD